MGGRLDRRGARARVAWAVCAAGLAAGGAWLGCSSSPSATPPADAGPSPAPKADAGPSPGAPGDAAAPPVEAGPRWSLVTPAEKTAGEYLAALPSGDLVLSEGTKRRLVQVAPDGRVVAVNDADFRNGDPTRDVVVDDAGRVLVLGARAVYLYAEGIGGPRTVYVAADGAKPIDHVAWGGSPKRLWALTANAANAPTSRIVRYDAATTTAAGTPTLVGELPRTRYAAMTVSDTGEVYLSDLDTCRILRVDRAGATHVVAGAALASEAECVTDGGVGRGADGARVGQGRGLGLDPTRARVLFADTVSRALVDVTPEADGVARAAVLARSDDAAELGPLVSTPGAVWVLDLKSRALHRVELAPAGEQP